MKNFAVVRLANKSDGTLAAPVSGFDTETEAWKEFFRLCGGAVDSQHPMDTVVLVTKEGFTLDSRCFDHTKNAPDDDANG